ncbi:unnamed protein product [Haemonchus placei]|uniref:Uncharacterized protein n=1 Tax=Haemonchus placei TaxID=6290 RepID=A0A0N4W756_HAEPC|nr:unnamed protein product [Haemonchus placei]
MRRLGRRDRSQAKPSRAEPAEKGGPEAIRLSTGRSLNCSSSWLKKTSSSAFSFFKIWSDLLIMNIENDHDHLLIAHLFKGIVVMLSFKLLGKLARKD